MEADRAQVARFLLRLGKLCHVPAELTVADVRERIAEYVPLLCYELPAGAFCEAAFAHVASQCRFFPAYAEVLGQLQSWWRDNRPRAAALPSPETAERQPPSTEERAEVAHMVAALVTELRGRSSANSPVGGRLPSVAARAAPLSAEQLARARAEHGRPGTQKPLVS